MMAWSFPESELGQIHSIQGLGHNHMLVNITPWGLGQGVGSGPAGPVLAVPLFIKVETKFHFAKCK